jgi:TetR/AcrR family transcriptional repressor of nem operon
MFVAMPNATAARATEERGTARGRLLDAAVAVIRTKGLSATSVDDLCAAAGVSKGAFFHHFESKEALAVAAADHWSRTTGALFAGAAYHDPDDPAARVLAYLDFRASLIGDAPEAYSCLAGTMVQEAFASNPAIRDACGESILGHASTLEADIAAALERARPGSGAQAAELARYTQTVLQGAFVVSKAADDPGVVHESIRHLRAYLEILFRTERGGGSVRRPEMQPAAQRVAVLVHTIDDASLGAPTPCPDYDVAALLDHVDGLVGAFTDAAAKARLDAEGPPPPGDAAHLRPDWRSRVPEALAALVAAWDDDAAFDGTTSAGGITMPAEVASLVAVEELVVHGWDLARATGQPYACTDAELQIVDGFLSMFPDDQRGDAYAPPYPVPSGASALDRVIAASGRDPAWSAR